MSEECKPCKILMDLYEKTGKDKEAYYLMTEVFVLLHGGKDHCDKAKENIG